MLKWIGLGLLVLVVAVVGYRVSTIDDTSYLSNYMRLRGTKFAFRPIGDGRTEVTLTVKFDRLLSTWLAHALSAKTGEHLWAGPMYRVPSGHGRDIFYIDGLFWFGVNTEELTCGSRLIRCGLGT